MALELIKKRSAPLASAKRRIDAARQARPSVTLEKIDSFASGPKKVSYRSFDTDESIPLSAGDIVKVEIQSHFNASVESALHVGSKLYVRKFVVLRSGSGRKNPGVLNSAPLESRALGERLTKRGIIYKLAVTKQTRAQRFDADVAAAKAYAASTKAEFFKRAADAVSKLSGKEGPLLAGHLGYSNKSKK